MGNKIYYYTDFNTFKLILENGTLRFKESTSSNDKLDTIRLYANLMEMANKKLKEEIRVEQKFYFDMLQHIGAKQGRLSLVSCFSKKSDSRMLWDAYTMHRKDRSADRYNGVCIEFDKDLLLESMSKAGKVFDKINVKDIIYGYDNLDVCLENSFELYSKEVDLLSKDEDQSQNIISPIRLPIIAKELVFKKCIVYPLMHLIDSFDVIAPFFKHSFWSEEDEVRAVLSLKLKSKSVRQLNRYSDGSYYYDLHISSNCISKVILGPEFSPKDIEEVLAINGKINYSDLCTEISEGTGIITNM